MGYRSLLNIINYLEPYERQEEPEGLGASHY